jgi:hypothetical protein
LKAHIVHTNKVHTPSNKTQTKQNQLAKEPKHNRDIDKINKKRVGPDARVSLIRQLYSWWMGIVCGTGLIRPGCRAPHSASPPKLWTQALELVTWPWPWL